MLCVYLIKIWTSIWIIVEKMYIIKFCGHFFFFVDNFLSLSPSILLYLALSCRLHMNERRRDRVRTRERAITKLRINIRKRRWSPIPKKYEQKANKEGWNGKPIAFTHKYYEFFGLIFRCFLFAHFKWNVRFLFYFCIFFSPVFTTTPVLCMLLILVIYARTHSTHKVSETMKRERKKRDDT